MIDPARKLSFTIPAGPNAVFTEEAAEGMVGQWFHLLINGHAYLAQVESAKLWDQGREIHLDAVWHPTEAEPDATPLEVTQDGQPYPAVEEA